MKYSQEASKSLELDFVMTSIFFTSDHHFWHKNIIHLCNRPFSSVEEMDAKMIENWNSVVAPSDTVYYLGDFSLDPRAVKEILPLLNGKKHLIQGNHDKCFKGKDKLINYYKEAGFESVKHRDTIKIWKYQVLLCHFPYKDNPEAKYYDKRPEDNGNWLLHGHIHEKGKFKNKMINVGVDVWNFTPVSLEQIEKHMKSIDKENKQC